jgi:hypothetical protein
MLPQYSRQPLITFLNEASMINCLVSVAQRQRQRQTRLAEVVAHYPACDSVTPGPGRGYVPVALVPDCRDAFRPSVMACLDPSFVTKSTPFLRRRTAGSLVIHERDWDLRRTHLGESGNKAESLAPQLHDS